MHASMRTAKSSPPRPIWGGRGGLVWFGSRLAPKAVTHGQCARTSLARLGTPLGCLVSQPPKLLTTPVPRQGAGGGGGLPGVRTRDPRHCLGGPCTRKNLFRTWVQIDAQWRQYTKRFCPPPPRPPLPKKGYPATGRYGGQNQKIHWGIILSLKMMNLQGVRHPIPYTGVWCTNDPKIGRYMAPVPALDLETSLRGAVG